MHASIVDSKISSLDTKCVTGHHEDLGVTGVFSPMNPLIFLMKKSTNFKIPGIGSSVTHQYARYPAFPGGLQTGSGSQLDKCFRQ